METPAKQWNTEERFVALAHLYLELDLSLTDAVSAAEADLSDLDRLNDIAAAA